MTTSSTPPPPVSGSSAGATPPSSPSPSAPGARPRSRLGLIVRSLLLLAVVGVGGYVYLKYPAEVKSLWEKVAGAPAKRVEASTKLAEVRPPWDGKLELTADEEKGLGIATVPVKPQTEPIRLELLGTTDYITDTLTKVRPMFKGRVDKVHVAVGQSVKKGDALVDFYSTELAQAKSVYEIERIQWLFDKKLLDIRETLLQSKTVSQQLYEETKNNEMKNRREYEVARDKLLVYGLTEAEVEKVDKEPGSQKARLTLHSPADGLVISRDVVAGNLYDENDTLLVIAPLDQLWVWGNVFESDLDLVHLGQWWEVQFPFLNHRVRGKVEYISNRVDPNTHAVKVRTSIPNVNGKLKSDMLVRVMLEIPPVEGRVVIPRSALVVVDGHNYVYVRSDKTPNKYERRAVHIAQEKVDHAVIEKGLKAGELVVSIGGLILDQMHEDQEVMAAGAPIDASAIQ